MSRADQVRLAGLAAFAAVALWLGLGAGGFVMIDQGDYVRTVKRMVIAPVDPIALPHSKPVSQRWTLAPFDEWKLRLYRGSATPVIAAAALPARLGDGVFDTRHMALGLSLLIAGGVLLVARRLAGGARAVAAIAAAALALPVVLAAHNAALLGAFYPEIAFVVALPFVVLALLMAPGRAAHLLLFAATATAAMAKAPFFYLPALVAFALWWFGRRPPTPDDTAPAPTRRGAWLALAAAQLMALVVVARGEFAAMNAHHATFLGSDYGLQAEQLSAAGLPREFHGCVGVDYWGNRVAPPPSLRVEPAPPECRALPTRTMTQALGTWLRHPTHFIALAWHSLPAHASADYFHLSPNARYRHRVGDGLATRLLDRVSQARDLPLRGLGLPLAAAVLLLGALLPLGRRLGAARLPLAVLAAFALSQIVVSLLGEGVRDLGKHLAAGQFAMDLGMAVLLMLGILRLLRQLHPRRRIEATGLLPRR